MRLIKYKAVFEIFLIVMTIFFIGYNSENVYAQDDIQGCCKDLGNGQYCQNIKNNNECSSGYSQTSCDYVGGCEQGCCNIVSKGGGCSEGVSKLACDKQGGSWTEGRLCENDDECFLGCCLLGNNQGYMTIKDDCDGDFKEEITDERQCIDLARKSEEGCCVKGKDCLFGIREECSGDFKKDKFCSSIPECGLKEHSYTDCGVGLKTEDVYWFDDKGNPEGVADDCDYFRGNICRDTNDDGKGDDCNSLDCLSTWDNPNVEGDGGLRKNGESWCEYQSAVGPGKDLPGSRHYRHVCQNGKEAVEACGSDRGKEGICVYHDLRFSNDEEYSVAACVDNTWEDCISCTDEYCCIDPAKTCVWGGDRCLPLVPPENSNNCNLGSLDVKTVWEQPCGGSWRCASGCEVYEDGFLFQTNSLCNIYGNCGAKYNLAGEFSNKGEFRGCSGKDCRANLNQNDVSFDQVVQAGLGLKTATQDIDDSACTWCGAEGAGSKVSLWLAVSSLGILLGAQFIGGVSILATVGSTLGLVPSTVLGPALVGTGGGVLGGSAGAESTLLAAKIAAISIVIAIVLLIAAAITYIILMTCGGTDKKTVSVSCGPWQPPQGGKDCWKCDTRMDRDEKGNDCNDGDCGLLSYSDSFKKGEYPAYECSEQLCKSLGTTCSFEQSKDGPICIGKSYDDIKSPKISHDMTNKDYYCNQEKPGRTGGCAITDEGTDGFRITNDLVDFYEGYLNKKWPPVYLKIKTDENSLCKYSMNPQATFEEMTDFFDMDGGVYSLKHNMTFRGLQNGTSKFYIRCEDFLQNRNEKSYVIEFNLADEPDLTAPLLESITPNEGSYIRFGQSNVSVSLEINEPLISSTKGSDLSKEGSGCKWGKEPNIDYDDMSNLMSCSSSILNGNECDGLLTDVKAGKNTFYFRCKDMDGNENTQDWPQRIGYGFGYTIYGSESNLSISSIGCLYSLPDGTQTDKCDEILAKNFTIKLTTAGGAKNGDAKCSYNGNEFLRTGGNIHEQCIGCGSGFGLLPGTNNYLFSCEDEGKNVVSAAKNLVVNVDSMPPEITAIYRDDSHLLNIETNEPSYCRYSLNKTFVFSESKLMISDNLLKHKVDIENSLFRIGCKDRFDNYNAPFNVYLL